MSSGRKKSESEFWTGTSAICIPAKIWSTKTSNRRLQKTMGSSRALTPGKEKGLFFPHDFIWLHQIRLQCKGSCQALGRETAARSLQRMPETIVEHLWDQVWLLSILSANVLAAPSSFQLAPQCWEARWINCDLKIWHSSAPLNKSDKRLLGFEEQVVQLLLPWLQNSAITKIDSMWLLHFLNLNAWR